MSVTIIDVSPDGDDVFVASADLDGVVVQFAFRWLPYVGFWTCQMKALDGSILSMVLAVRTAGELLFDARQPGTPPGRLAWDGPSDYVKSDLGTLVNLMYVPNG